MWHASVAVQDMAQRRTLTTRELSIDAITALGEVAKQLLSGVGSVPSAVELHSVAVHYRRSLTDEEYARLPEAWCAIQAVHEAGRGIVLEENT